MGQGFLGCSMQGVPWQSGWIQAGVIQVVLECSVLGYVVASCLESKWYGPVVFWGTLFLCHLDMTAGAVMSADQGCLDVCRTGGALMGWLWLM